MQYSFNLIDQPWIPVIHSDGRLEEFGLREALLRAHEFRAIQGESPLATAALHRLLLAILHRVFGPESRTEWKELWNAGQFPPGALEAYLSAWKSRFDLFDIQRPFYQMRDERAKPKSVINLVIDMASGNNAALFDHHTEEGGAELSAAQAARTLVVAHTFGLAGLANPQLKLTFTDAPCARGIVFLLEGENLFETLMLNLMRYDVDHSEPLPGQDVDSPAWEMEDPYKPDRQNPLGYLDYLTWQNRRILLLPQEKENGEIVVRQITVLPGLRLDASVTDPMKHYRRDEEHGALVWRFSEERVLWRDSSALFELNTPDKFQPPKNISWAAELVRHGILDREKSLRFMALGMANDQAKVEFFRSEHMPLPLSYLAEDEQVAELSLALQWSNAASSALWKALSLQALLVIAPKDADKDWGEISKETKENAKALVNHWGCERSYWAQLEIPFYSIMRNLPTNPSRYHELWIQAVITSARNALDEAGRLAGDSAEALRARVRAKEKLEYELATIFKRSEAQ